MGTATTLACQIDHLSVAYQDTIAVSDVSLRVSPGQVVALLGPNGAGKSTVMKASLRLVPTLAGEVAFFGEPLPRVRSRLAYVPQTATVDWDFPTTVGDVVLMGTYAQLGWLRRPGARQREAAAAAMERLGISDLAHRHINELSGGQQQRTFVARALAQNAELYLMDEPFAGIDITSQQAIMTLLRELVDEGKTVMIVHHDLQTVPDFCDSVVLLSGGNLVAAGSVAEAFTADNIARAYGLSVALDRK